LLTTLLVAVFAVVIASGLWGLALQNVLPRMLLEGAPAETVYSQIDAVGRQYATEARRLVFLHCGAAEGDDVDTVPRPTSHHSPLPTHSPSHIRGAARPVGTQIRRSPHQEHELPQAIPAPAIRSALAQTIEPYLSTGVSPQGQMGSRQRNQWFFDDLRLRVAPQLRDLVAQLEELCERRRQLNLQRRVHFWLHNWLGLHVPLSVLLMILLAAHVFWALQYN